MRVIAILYLFLVPLFLHGQNESTFQDIDHRLYDVYEKDYLKKLKNKNPFLLERWAYYLDHAFYLTELPKEKITKHYPIVKIKDLSNINILLLEKEQKLVRNWDVPTIYKIAKTKKYLVYLPGKKFTAQLKKNLSKKR